MVTPYFSSIKSTLVKALEQATASIDIAVAWFTNEQIFNVILKKLKEGINVRIVLINDDINHCGGLDFQSFIDNGGLLFFGKSGFFMHNKYCIIDRNMVYTGSYNYTYFAEHSNFENIVCITEEESAIAEYVKNYDLILSVSDYAKNIKSFLDEHPFTLNIHSSRHFLNRDSFQKAQELYENNDIERADQIIKKLSLDAENDKETFIIRDVLYKQWQPGYCIRKIEVTNMEILIDIQVRCDSCFFLYGPGLNKTWHLRTSSKTVYASSINNVRLDGSTLIDIIDKNTTYRVNEPGHDPINPISTYGKTLDGTPRRTIELSKPVNTKSLSCTLVFPKDSFINETIDLLEGDNNDINAAEYWHFLSINLLLNRETN